MTTPKFGPRFRVTWRHETDAVIDVDRFAEAFPEERAECDADEEFVWECVESMGADIFDNEWVVSRVNDDYDFHVIPERPANVERITR